ncbi:MAG: NADH-quinone oxidoreductase subunit J [Planctomycetota bacterium]
MKQELLQKIFYGALGLLTLLALGVGLAAAGGEGLAFALFAVLTIGGGIVCVWERSVVRSAFALMATFTGIAGLFLLLEADFLAMAQILIYVGGILALLLFAVMLTPPDLGERKLSRVTVATAFVGGGTLWLALEVARTAHWFTQGAPLDGRASGPVGSAERIGVGFLAADQYVIAFELAAVILTVALVAAVYVARRKRSDLEPEKEGA